MPFVNSGVDADSESDFIVLLVASCNGTEPLPLDSGLMCTAREPWVLSPQRDDYFDFRPAGSEPRSSLRD